MRVALLFCGQMRTFDHPKVLEFNNTLIEKFNCDVFVSTWQNRGVSMWTVNTQDFNLYEEQKDEKISEIDVKLIKNVRDYQILNYDEYLEKYCLDEIRQGLLSNIWSLGSVTSHPQAYTMHVAALMKKKYEEENNIKYDVVIKSRPDFFQVHNDIEKYFEQLENTCYNINTGLSYCPNRVYDIFLLSNSSTMDILCDVYNNYSELSKTSHGNHLSKYDACRLLYAQCMENNIEVKSFDKVLGDIFRIENYKDPDWLENYYR
jgi:hypothetical protein